jgi:hypothetical protein
VLPPVHLLLHAGYAPGVCWCHPCPYHHCLLLLLPLLLLLLLE